MLFTVGKAWTKVLSDQKICCSRPKVLGPVAFSISHEIGPTSLLLVDVDRAAFDCLGERRVFRSPSVLISYVLNNSVFVTTVQ